MTNKIKENDFTKGPIASALIKFSLPLMLAILLQALYGAVDLIIVGKFSTNEATSAVATGSQVISLFTIVVADLTVGVTVLISQAIGEKNKKKATDTVTGQMKLFFFVAIILTLICLFLAAPLARLMNAPVLAFDQTVTYIRICGTGMIFIVLYNSIAGIFRGIGDSKSPLIFVTIASVVNILLDLLFVIVFNMGSSGAAIATITAQGVSVAFSVIYIKRVKLPFKINKKIFQSKGRVLDILRLGSPIALQDFLTGVSFLIITSLINKMGIIASGAIGIEARLFVFLSIIPMSFMSSLSAFVGQNAGAKKINRAKSALKIAVLISGTIGIIMSLFTYFQGAFIASLFTNDPEIIRYVTLFIKNESPDYFFFSIMFCFLGYFNGLGRSTFPMIQGLISTFLFRVPVSVYLASKPDVNMWDLGIAAPISGAVGLFLSILYLIYLSRKSDSNLLKIDSTFVVNLSK